MSADTPQNKPPKLFDFINSTLGKITIAVTFATTVFTAFKLLGGDTRLAVVVLSLIGTVACSLGSLYVLLKKNEIRTTTVKTGLKIQRDYTYAKGFRYAALAVLTLIPALWAAGFYFNVIEALAGKKIN